jgi:hypothetical protein
MSRAIIREAKAWRRSWTGHWGGWRAEKRHEKLPSRKENESKT